MHNGNGIGFLQKLKSVVGFYFSIQDIDEHYVLKLFGAKICLKHKIKVTLPDLKESGVTEQKRDKKLIVSLTTYPARINSVYKTITTLLNQTVKPDEVILWLAKEQFPNMVLPENLTNLEKFGLKIKWCDEDIKSFKKLVPALMEYPEDIIITVDDDYYYDRRLVEELYNAHLQNPECIFARQAFVVRKKDNEFYLKSRRYIYDETYLPSFLNEPVGCGGVLYPPSGLHKNVTNTKQFMAEVPTHDDLWFWSHALRNNTKIAVIKNGYKLKNIETEGSQADALWQKNMINSSSNVGMTGKEALNKLCGMFPEIVEKLK